MILFCMAHKPEFKAAFHASGSESPYNNDFNFIPDKEIVLLRSGFSAGTIHPSITRIIGLFKDVNLIVDSGCCGSLDPEISLGSVVCSSVIHNCKGDILSGSIKQNLNLERFGIRNTETVFTHEPIDKISKRDEIKRESGCSVCNMESGYILDKAKTENVRFLSLRVVTDYCNRRFSPEYLREISTFLKDYYTKITSFEVLTALKNLTNAY